MTHARTHACIHARTHTHGANYNLPPASRAGDNNTHTQMQFFFSVTLTQAILFSDADFAQIRKCGKCIVLYAAIT